MFFIISSMTLACSKTDKDGLNNCISVSNIFPGQSATKIMRLFLFLTSMVTITTAPASQNIFTIIPILVDARIRF